MYVADTLNNVVSVIDESTKTKPHSVSIKENTSKENKMDKNIDMHPSNMTIDTIKGKVYVVNTKSNTVSVIDENTNKVMNKSIQVGMVPLGIDY